MAWTVLHMVGILSYAATGAFVALETRYSFVGVYALGFITAFGGSVIRNIIIGIPVVEIWEVHAILTVTITLTIIIIIPLSWIDHWRRFGFFFDSIGLASFALQGAMLADAAFNHHLGAILLAAMFTGVGGGMMRDVIAGRKPLALKEEVHAILTVLCALCIWLGFHSTPALIGVVIVVVTLRMLAVHYQWRVPLPCHREVDK